MLTAAASVRCFRHNRATNCQMTVEAEQHQRSQLKTNQITLKKKTRRTIEEKTAQEKEGKKQKQRRRKKNDTQRRQRQRQEVRKSDLELK